jgi:hypothetical protein
VTTSTSTLIRPPAPPPRPKVVLARLIRFAMLTDEEVSGLPANLPKLEHHQLNKRFARAISAADLLAIKMHLRQEEDADALLAPPPPPPVEEQMRTSLRGLVGGRSATGLAHSLTWWHSWLAAR